MITVLKRKSDELGILSSSLCILHCLLTPVLPVVFSATSVRELNSYEWWGAMDIIFLLVALVAIYRTAWQTTIRWVRVGLLISWLLLTLLTFNERLEGVDFPLDMMYFPAT